MLAALDPVGVSMLVELLVQPATEAELLDKAEDASQPTANRRLDRLLKARIVAQEHGERHAPGRLWTVVHPFETEALLTALFALSDAIDSQDKKRRDQARRKLKQARAARLGIREAGGRKAG